MGFIFLDDFLPKKPGVCNNDENIYGDYDSLETAQQACLNDTDCIAVQDEGCDGTGVFHHCKRGTKGPSSSCIYPKKNVHSRRKCCNILLFSNNANLKPASFNIIFELHSVDLERFTCFDIVLYNGGKDAYTWELGPCVPSHAFDYDVFEYTEKCCVPNGNYLLSCNVKDRSSSGWLTNSFVRIGRHKFCDDIPGYNALRAINVLGMNIHISNTLCLIFPTILY